MQNDFPRVLVRKPFITNSPTIRELIGVMPPLGIHVLYWWLVPVTQFTYIVCRHQKIKTARNYTNVCKKDFRSI